MVFGLVLLDVRDFSWSDKGLVYLIFFIDFFFKGYYGSFSEYLYVFWIKVEGKRIKIIVDMLYLFF